jgi:DNA-directed RNA polymerase sigma subunit (sigma70/sigma32)
MYNKSMTSEYIKQMIANEKRRAEIYEYKQDNPELSLRAIGGKFGISGERVRQIIKAELDRINRVARLRVKYEKA